MEEEIGSPQKRLKSFIVQMFNTTENFCKSFDVSPNYMSKYIGSGKSVIKNFDKITKLSEMGLNIDWYLTGQGEMLLNQTSTTENKKNKFESNAQETTRPYGFRVKFVNVLANAGIGYNFNDIPEGELMTAKDYPDTVKAFIVSGDSMQPSLFNGDTVYVDEAIEPRNNDIVMAVVDGVLVCKRLVFREEKRFLVSENTQYDEIRINGFNNSKIIGKVIESFRKH